MARKQQMKAIKDKNVNYLNCPDHLSILLLLLLLMLDGGGGGEIYGGEGTMYFNSLRGTQCSFYSILMKSMLCILVQQVTLHVHVYFLITAHALDDKDIFFNITEIHGISKCHCCPK